VTDESDQVVGLLVEGAVHRARRQAPFTVDAADRRSTSPADRVWVVVLDHLGCPDWLAALRDGAVTPSARETAVAEVEDAASRDPAFGDRLRTALRGQVTQSAHATGAGHTATRSPGAFQGNVLQAGGNITITQWIGQRYRANPTAFIAMALAVFAVVVASGYGVVRAIAPSAGSSTSADAGSGPEEFAGTWSTGSGSDVKTFSQNGGPCKGFYYNAGEPLDIGGPMTCTISSKPDAQGRYSLRVVQSPNEATYRISFDAADHATVYGSDGGVLYELSRF